MKNRKSTWFENVVSVCVIVFALFIPQFEDLNHLSEILFGRIILQSCVGNVTIINEKVIISYSCGRIYRVEYYGYGGDIMLFKYMFDI